MKFGFSLPQVFFSKGLVLFLFFFGKGSSFVFPLFFLFLQCFCFRKVLFVFSQLFSLFSAIFLGMGCTSLRLFFFCKIFFRSGVLFLFATGCCFFFSMDFFLKDFFLGQGFCVSGNGFFVSGLQGVLCLFIFAMMFCVFFFGVFSCSGYFVFFFVGGSFAFFFFCMVFFCLFFALGLCDFFFADGSVFFFLAKGSAFLFAFGFVLFLLFFSRFFSTGSHVCQRVFFKKKKFSSQTFCS